MVGIGAASGGYTYLFIYPDRVLKFTDGYLVLIALCEWQNLTIWPTGKASFRRNIQFIYRYLTLSTNSGYYF